MSQPGAPDGWRSLADSPPSVQVTVVPGPRTARARDRIRSIRGAGALLVAGLVAVAAVIAVVGVVTVVAVVAGSGSPGLHSAGHGLRVPTATVRNDATTTGLAAVAAAYAAPLGCLGQTIAAGAPAQSATRPDRSSPCWHYGVYVTVVFHRVDGVWRLMLQATSPKCPAVALPDIVRSALVTCERSGAADASG